MHDDVPFSKVVELLEKHGYRLLRSRKFPDEENAGFVVFGRQDSPNIGFPVRNRKVAYEHFQTLIEAFEGDDEST